MRKTHGNLPTSMGPTTLQACFHVGPIIFLSVKLVLYIDYLSLCCLLCVFDCYCITQKNNLYFILKCMCNMRNMKINEIK